ncbi:unnamed protein product [Nippostrongylus brasiliensis]|uniref:Glypican-6 n=1 Tax=Nippostrongylus brasiliensis TaxID=27835 RepID=A0A158QX30_NIPBR|nr:unnamed protein product [Nippostrongylus brasiliensis]
MFSSGSFTLVQLLLTIRTVDPTIVEAPPTFIAEPLQTEVVVVISSREQAALVTQEHEPRANGAAAVRPFDATDLKICKGRNACCTKRIEDEIVKSSGNIFKSQIEDKLIVLRHLVNSNANAFRTFFYNSLNACHEQLDALFGRTYGPFYQRNSQVFDTFFNRLRAFSSPFSNVKVSQVVDRLFEEMFVIIYQLINPMQTVTVEQRRCMIEGMEEIRPFSDISKKLTIHMEKSLLLWKQFVTGLDQVHEILGSFMNVSMSEKCRINVARLWDCSLCSGEAESKPCPELCVDVMQGCLIGWAQVDQQWNSVIDSLRKISTRLRGAQNLHSVLQPLPVQLSEAVMEMQERGITVSNKVVARCYSVHDHLRVALPMEVRPHFENQRRRRDIAHRTAGERAINFGKVLDTLLDSFKDRLTTLRGWFTGLPKSLCMDSALMADDGEDCWNGSASGNYSKENGLVREGENPNCPSDLPMRGLFVDERLRLGMLAFRLQNTFRSHNYTSYQIEGSADAEDDEDYAEGSGSLSIVSLYSSESREKTSDLLPHTLSNSMQHLVHLKLSAALVLQLLWWLS